MRGVQKPILHDTRADYEIAKQGGRFRRPRKGVSGVGTSGDFHFRNETQWLYSIEYARDLDRNDVVAGMVVDRLLDSILQDAGIRPDPTTGDENADAWLKSRWNNWAADEDQCDLAGEMTFQDMERHVLRSTIVDGDILPLPNISGALELMEAHRCRTPTNTSRNVVFGVELNDLRQRERYLFTRDELDPRRALRLVRDTVAIDARDSDGERQVFHVYNPNRVSQTRGVSAFARVADPLGMHDDIQFANLVRQQIASCFAIIRSKKQQGPLSTGQYGARDTSAQTSGYTRTLENIAPGMEIGTEPNEEISGFSPNVPNPQFFEHVQLILKLVSANLGIPLHAVLLDASQTNFSGWRGAHDQARQGYRRIQSWLIRKFHRRVYLWKVRNWLQESSELRAWAQQSDVNIFGHKWNRPSWEYVQPVQDTAADVAKIRGLITTMRRVHASRGDDFDEVISENVKDNARLFRACRDAAREINAEAEDDSERITWREMLAMPLHEGLSVAITASADDVPTENANAPE